MEFYVYNYNGDYITTIEIENPDNYDELYYYRREQQFLTAKNSQTYNSFYRNFVLNWTHITESKFYEIVLLIATQNSNNIFWKNGNNFINVKFDGDIVFVKDGVRDITTLTINMVEIG